MVHQGGKRLTLGGNAPVRGERLLRHTRHDLPRLRKMIGEEMQSIVEREGGKLWGVHGENEGGGTFCSTTRGFSLLSEGMKTQKRDGNWGGFYAENAWWVTLFAVI